MKSPLLVCLVVLSLFASVALPAMAQVPTLEPGIGVQMPVTVNAQKMPGADNADARIVTVTEGGAIYFGVNRVAPAQLLEEMKQLPRTRGQKLYIKSDAQAPVADVDQVLEAARGDLFQTAVLLTAQPEPASPGEIVPPKGLEVVLARKPSSDLVRVELQTEPPALTVNHREILWEDLHNTLRQVLENRTQKLIVVKADGQTAFAQLARVIDTCRSVGANVILPAR